MNGREWQVWVVPTRVIDGDTFECLAELGWGVWRHGERVRVLGVNTPERGKPGAKEATEAAKAWLGLGGTDPPAPLRLVSHAIEPVRFGAGRDSFGRILGTVFDAEGVSLAAYLIAGGFGVEYRTGG